MRLFSLYSAINTTDPTWDNVPVSYWTVVELNCGIICACLSTLRPLISKLVPWTLHHSGLASEQDSDATTKDNNAARGYKLRDVESRGSQDELRVNAAAGYHEDDRFAPRPSGRSPVFATTIRGGKSARDAGHDKQGLASISEDDEKYHRIKVRLDTTVEESRVGGREPTSRKAGDKM